MKSYFDTVSKSALSIVNHHLFTKLSNLSAHAPPLFCLIPKVGTICPCLGQDLASEFLVIESIPKFRQVKKFLPLPIAHQSISSLFTYAAFAEVNDI